ncbi:MAG: trypsin-like peptidase domain-containing protein [Pirellulaceae bacterium]|nr:trypsin-like peptidase domain-containing protein [Pirellulaceae bacterium]
MDELRRLDLNQAALDEPPAEPASSAASDVPVPANGEPAAIPPIMLPRTAVASDFESASPPTTTSTAAPPAPDAPAAASPPLSQQESNSPLADATPVGRPAVQLAAPVPHPLYRIVWLLCALAGLVLLTAILPPFAERMQFALTRGRQRAEFEEARRGLGELPLAQLSKAYQLVSLKVGPSVVHINLAGPALSAEATEPLGGRRGMQRRFEGQGSGVIVDPEGYIVTNRHVVVGSRDIQVKLSDGRVVRARIVGVDALTDLAVLKVDADNLIAAQWGDSDQLEVGALVWALGSPFGLERSVTFGILSAKHRSDTAGSPYQDFLQTDAAVNPGNSGGPLVDVTGRVVGINTAIVGEAYQGISFSIPSRVARPVYERLRSQGHVQRGWLGVQPEPLTMEMAAELGLPDTRGALIAALAENSGGSPARQAGLQVGDVVIRWDGKPIDNPADLFMNVGLTEIGRAVEVTVVRRGRQETLTVVVGARSEQS